MYHINSGIDRKLQLFLWNLLALLPLVLSAPTDDGNALGDSGTLQSLTSDNIALGVIVCVVVFLLLVVVAVPGCMDCMNSEVSSESHPACGDTSRKWGGAVDYTPADSRNPGAGFTTGEVVNPSDPYNQQLPYAMIPTQVPEQAGFVGYQSGVGGDGGLAGYSAGPGRHPSGSEQHQQQQHRHYNPMSPEDPPPAYTDAAF
ncbi:uncharacterized protein LOC101848969 [Aplysia californica]|uniref:Uncharacterized protein LOC101848969 n=1 Tax=Aplysia californica TaxID=6500 RepID=A0ABM0JQ26_APLCA|nr:uncharacterized protein LOC101848969 [Aplysia californica]